jgi:hypothetical protein
MPHYEGNMQKVWNESPIKKRKELLKATGLHTSFAKVKYEDLPKRSGGHVVREMEALFKYGRKKGRY